MKTKYRIKVVAITKDEIKHYYVQWKRFLFWHTEKDSFGDPWDIGSLERAERYIRQMIDEAYKKVEYINID